MFPQNSQSPPFLLGLEHGLEHNFSSEDRGNEERRPSSLPSNLIIDSVLRPNAAFQAEGGITLNRCIVTLLQNLTSSHDNIDTI